jgi:hypothetical protein
MLQALRNIGFVVIGLTFALSPTTAVAEDNCWYGSAEWLSYCDGPGSFSHCGGCIAWTCDDVFEGGIGIIC